METKSKHCFCNDRQEQEKEMMTVEQTSQERSRDACKGAGKLFFCHRNRENTHPVQMPRNATEHSDHIRDKNTSSEFT